MDRRSRLLRYKNRCFDTGVVAEAIPNIVAGVRIGPLAGEKFVIEDAREGELAVGGVMEIDHLRHRARGQQRGNYG